MKQKRIIVLLSLGLLLLVFIAVIPFGADAQGQNLLTNPGFEEGHYNQDNIAEITVPNGWRMHWSDREFKIFGGYEQTARPETVVWNISGAPDHERDVFWKDGIYTVKIFKGWAPVWAAMSQDVGGLEVGRRYRLVAPVYIDIVAEYDSGKKVAPVDGRQGRVRLGASPVGTAWRDEANINYSGWWTGETISPFYLAYPTFIHEFTATAPEMTVWIEMASNYPHPNNGFFIDTVGLYALDEVSIVANVPAANQKPGEETQPAGPPATPLPTPTPRADGAVVHIVQSGDSFWSLAVQYAETMGLTPEEALKAIPDQNNNPAVISSGDELIIVPPSAGGGPPEEGTGEGAEEAPEAEATPEGAPGEETDAAPEDGEDAEETTDSSGSESAITQALPNIRGSSVCVQVYADTNSDGVRTEGESFLADQAVTLSQAGNTITTYITDGSEDLHCFEELEANSYQVQIFPTADYVVNGDDSWAVALSEGVMIPVNFILSDAPEGVADAGQESDSATAEADQTEMAPEDNSGGFVDNLGFIALGAAVVLILLAGVGVYLLRRG